MSVFLLGAPRRRIRGWRRRPDCHLCRDHEVAACRPSIRTLEQLIRGRKEIARVGAWWCVPCSRLCLWIIIRRLFIELLPSIKHGFSGRIDRLAQRRRQTVQSPVAQDTSQGTLTTPFPAGMQCDFARDVVFVVVHVQSQRAANMVFDDFREARLAVEDAFGGAQDVIRVGEQTGQVGGRVGRDIEDVPYVGYDREGCPLESETEGGAVGGHGDV